MGLKKPLYAKLGLEVGLYQPQIPQNSGNIGRLCVGFGVPLHFIEPLGFSLEAKQRRRAGLDYWDKLDWKRHKDFDSFYATVVENTTGKIASRRMFCLSTKTEDSVANLQFYTDDVLLFGNETAGFPQDLAMRYGIRRVKLPMMPSIRSYNLANSVAMALVYASISLNNAKSR